MSHRISSGYFSKALFAGISIWLIGGCSGLAGPEYQRPEVPEKPNWSALEGREVTTSEVIQPEWWRGFGDTKLDGLVDQAIADGLDLRILALRMEQAGLAVRNAKGDLLPNVTLSPSRTMGRESQGGNTSRIDDSEALGLSGAWEIDLWGKLRKQRNAAEANYKASEMDWRGGYLTLVGAVANKYFLIRQFDQQIDNQKASQRYGEQLLEIYKAQFEEGMVADTTIRSQQAEINRIRGQLVEQNRARRQAELELATLLGQPAGALNVEPALVLKNIQRIPAPQVLPADMLARRPDVLRAEYDLLAAHHLVGVARLKRLPTLKLDFSAATGASVMSQFLDSWKFAFTLNGQGMFDRNVRREIRGAEVSRKIATETYRRAVLNAVQEVEVRLNNLNARQEQVAVLEDQVVQLETVRNVRRARLAEGLVSQLELFDTERELLNAQQGVMDGYGQILTETVELYKALGGGWPAESPTDVVAR